MIINYPIAFHPILKQRIWGGEKLVSVFKKESSEKGIGESWEISDLEGDVSVVANGPLQGKSLKALLREFKGDFVGHKNYDLFGDNFPILIKYIDAKTPLSIQVHPNNELAKQRHNSFGKNEMWYIMETDKNAELIIGFNQKVNQEEYMEALNNGDILEILNTEKIAQGDTFYIPTGRVHAIGAGVVLAEIQQTSDVTYRIYDYKRVDAKTGLQRELHTHLALDAIDYTVHDSYKTPYKLKENESSKLVYTPYFKTNIIKLKGAIKKDYRALDSFVIYMCVEGYARIKHNNTTYPLILGATVLLPACIKNVELVSDDAKILEVYL